MRTKLAKTLRKTFKEKMKVRFPAFKEVEDHEDPGGGLLFAQRLSDRMFFYVLLDVSPKRDEFAVIAGWTPVEGAFEHMTDDPDVSQPQWFWRLRGPSKGRWKRTDDWWLLQPRPPLWGPSPAEQKAYTDAVMHEPKQEDLMHKVEPMVEEAMQRIEQQAVPCFERVKERR